MLKSEASSVSLLGELDLMAQGSGDELKSVPHTPQLSNVVISPST